MVLSESPVDAGVYEALACDTCPLTGAENRRGPPTPAGLPLELCPLDAKAGRGEAPSIALLFL